MKEKKIFKRVLQVCVVVKNLEKAVKKYEEFGFGPWQMHTLGPSNISDMTVRNKRTDYEMRVALTKIGDVEWELVEPLDEKSIYADFLKKQGEGLHHVAFDVDNFDDTLAFCQDKGIGVLQGGIAYGTGFAYLDTEDSLSCIAEIYNPPDKQEG